MVEYAASVDLVSPLLPLPFRVLLFGTGYPGVNTVGPKLSYNLRQLSCLASEFRDCRGDLGFQGWPGLHDVWHCSTGPRAGGCLMRLPHAEATLQ